MVMISLMPASIASEDGIFAERRRNVDHGRGRAGRFNGFAHGVEHRQAQMSGAAFAWRHAANHLRTVSDRLFRVEGPPGYR